MRCFFAIEIPKEIIDNIMIAIEDCRKIQSQNIKYIPAKNLHITLKFLGNISLKQVEAIKKDLEAALCRIPELPKKLAILGLGSFPLNKKPKIIWAGIENSDTLKPLFNMIENISEKHGIAVEERDFKPHLTIGRIKSAADNNLIKYIHDNQKNKFGYFTPTHFHLIKSDLTGAGAIYTKIHTFSLKQNSN